jgi:hypothetical protein
MRRRFTAMVGACALVAAAAVPAQAAEPGATFPEQPGAHVATACSSVLGNPGNSDTGAATLNESTTAGAIKTGLVIDACFGA